ncbi:MAG: signal peptidase I [Oscillospiraceae bacterium]|jgi:signal peptidase|nr:signal peptidase I [Oscillospiraceae bacterium]
MKTLGQIDREFQTKQAFPAVQVPANDPAGLPAPIPSAVSGLRRRRRLPALTNALFYLTLAGVLLSGVFYGMGGRRGLLGYSYFSIVSTSMQSEIPRGSLAVVKRAAPQTVNAGDDIAFHYGGSAVVVVHRVLRIITDGENGLTFETKGTDNPLPDPARIRADNVIGRVVYHTAELGDVFLWLRARWFVLPALLTGMLGLTALSCRLPCRERRNGEGRKPGGEPPGAPPAAEGPGRDGP